MTSPITARAGVRRRGQHYLSDDDGAADEENPADHVRKNGSDRWNRNNNRASSALAPENEEAKVHKAANWAQAMDWIIACRWFPRRSKLQRKLRGYYYWMALVVVFQIFAILAISRFLQSKWKWKRTTTTGDAHQSRRKMEQHFHVVFPNISATAKFSNPPAFSAEMEAALITEDVLGGLAIEPLVVHEGPFRRKIQSNDYDIAEQERIKLLAEDASKIIPYRYWYNDDLESLHLPCRRPAWAMLQFLNCNTFHEISLDRDFAEGDNAEAWSFGNLQEYDNYLVNHGYYRDVWVNRKPSEGTTTIFKTTRIYFDFGWRNLLDVQREALIMERLTVFSNIITSYGHCGTSVLTEAVPNEVERYVVPGTGYYSAGANNNNNHHHNGDSDLPLESHNDLSAEEKLQTALAMAESIAVLHGNKDGVIVHNDIQLQQWLRTNEGILKLGDFNRASIPDWNIKENSYCKYSTGAAFGNVS